jgi:antitoxin (DNA-binding transcriptional repressor) of toxin-antitoxin stability system
MDEISASEFKAKCLAIMARVKRTGKPVNVTKFGEALVTIVPPLPPSKPQRKLGSMAGTGKILGDIVSPLDTSDWESLK